MEVTAEIKDQNLKELLDSAMVYTGEDRVIAAILSSDGYVTLQGTNTGDVCTITPNGRAFISQGGYTAKEREKVQHQKEAEAAKELESQNRLQEIEMQRLISEQLMEKDHEFQARQNKANRRNNIISGLIAAIISAVVALVMQAL